AGVETLSGVGVVSGAVWVVCSGVGVLLSMDWETSGVLVSWLLSAALSLEPPQAVMDKIRARDIPYMIAFFISDPPMPSLRRLFYSLSTVRPVGGGFSPGPPLGV